VEKALPDGCTIHWRYFSLYQINHEGESSWRIWQQPSQDPDWQQRDYAPSLRSFWAAEAARQQGLTAFQRFHRALLGARHQQGRSLAKPETVRYAAETAGLDMSQFREALQDARCLERLAADHVQAVERDIFGTPTFVFLDAVPAYLKLAQTPTPEQSLGFWHEFYRTVAERPYVLEIKRPH
jgi:predicted DsbA family dithiol-disulfide isomerase